VYIDIKWIQNRFKLNFMIKGTAPRLRSRKDPGSTSGSKTCYTYWSIFVVFVTSWR